MLMCYTNKNKRLAEFEKEICAKKYVCMVIPILALSCVGMAIY